MKRTIKNELLAHLEVINLTIETMQEKLERASLLVVETLRNGNKILLCGNGGSAADAQHIAAELIGRYKSERRGLAAIALTTDTSILTSVGNDYGYDRIFDRQIEALANKGDLIIGISTSGNSKNIISALTVGKEIGCKTLGLTGNYGGIINKTCDINLIVPSIDTPRIQEMHIVFGHIICQIVDNELS